MPFRPEHSLLRVEVPALHTIDTRSVENLFGMWSLFSKTSHAMEDGKRLENLSWRLWNRETFCCAPASNSSSAPHAAPSSSSIRRSLASRTRHSTIVATTTRGERNVPALSSSLDSASSEEEFETSSPVAPRINHSADADITAECSRSRGNEKHITPIDLEKIVISIKETKQLEPIELPMPPSMSASEPTTFTSQLHEPTPSPSTDESTQDLTPQNLTSSQVLESSASTVGTHGSQDSEASQSSQVVGSQESSSTEMSSHSIVRGFTPGGAPSSYRSQTTLATQPTPILKTSSQYRQQPPKRKGPMFTIGTSSGEDESSLDSHMHRSNLSESLRQSGSLTSTGSKKKASFKDEVAVARPAQYSSVFGSDDEDEDGVSESAIDDDDDSSDWEDSDDAQSGPSSVNGEGLFQRVDSRPNLTSRRSLLTTLMHEPDRARALANAASRSTPALRRSRTSTPNGPSVATSPEPSSHLQIPGHQQTRPQPIIMTTSNTHQQMALSPKTTRRNMLSTELTESLRKNLIWERQHRSTGNLAAMKRRHTSNDVKNLKQHPEPGPVLSHKEGATKKFTNDYFHAGLGEYHAKGW